MNSQDYFHKKKIPVVAADFTESLLKRYKWTCPRCAESLQNGEKMELHHIKPVREGGLTNLSNMMPLHRFCHQQITHS
jgi:5-methylcytosine-specific restriction endonuclease McrA